MKKKTITTTKTNSNSLQNKPLILIQRPFIQMIRCVSVSFKNRSQYHRAHD